MLQTVDMTSLPLHTAAAHTDQACPCGANVPNRLADRFGPFLSLLVHSEKKTLRLTAVAAAVTVSPPTPFPVNRQLTARCMQEGVCVCV